MFPTGLTRPNPTLTLRPTHPILPRDLQPTPEPDKNLLRNFSHIRIQLRSPRFTSGRLISPTQQTWTSRRRKTQKSSVNAVRRAARNNLPAIHRIRSVVYVRRQRANRAVNFHVRCQRSKSDGRAIAAGCCSVRGLRNSVNAQEEF